jgi:hypothetical protein
MSNELESNLIFHTWSLQPNQSENNKFNSNLHPMISYHSIKYSDKTLYIWIGDGESKLQNLTCSMKTPFDDEPSSCDLLMVNNQDSDYVNLSNDLAGKLAKRLNKQVLVGFNVKLDPQQLIPELNNNHSTNNNLLFLIEKRIIDEIKQYPQYF